MATHNQHAALNRSGGASSREDASAAGARADSADARARTADEEAASLRDKLQAAEEAARGATEAGSAELRRERELASDVALNLQAQIGELKQHSAQVRDLRKTLPHLGSMCRTALCGYHLHPAHAAWLETCTSAAFAGLGCS